MAIFKRISMDNLNKINNTHYNNKLHSFHKINIPKLSNKIKWIVTIINEYNETVIVSYLSYHILL